MSVLMPFLDLQNVVLLGSRRLYLVHHQSRYQIGSTTGTAAITQSSPSRLPFLREVLLLLLLGRDCDGDGLNSVIHAISSATTANYCRRCR